MDGASTLFSAFALIGGPVLCWHGVKAMRVRQLMEETPTSRIRSMAMGLVEVNGRVASRSRVSAPFSGRPCAYWEIEIATRTGQSRSGRREWHTVHRNCSGHPFYLRDETGLALIYPQRGEVRMPFGVEEETGGLGVPELYMDYMTRQGLGMRNLWALGAMRFRERVLEDDFSVFVLGRAFPRAMSVDVAFDEEALQATGTESAGAAHVRTLDSEVRGVIRRGEHDPILLISPQSEKTTSFEYALKGYGGMFGGAALTIFGVWCLLELARSGQLPL